MSIAVTTTDPTNTGVSTTSSSSLTGSNAADLQSSFLTLLVAQLKNQDPTNPMENNELTSQLAQISTVSGIEKLNTTLGSISGQIDNSQSLQASNLIGHGVMIPGTTVLAGTGSEEGAVTRPRRLVLSCNRRQTKLRPPSPIKTVRLCAPLISVN